MSDLELTPPELREAAMVASSNLLPAKSRGRYVKAFKLHSDWASSKNAPHVTGNVLLAYFNELAAHKKPSTLWATYSMLKATINIKKNIDIAKYPKLQEFLKKENTGYKAKKSNVLTLAQVQEYLNRAPEDSLPIKSALIISISGACRSDDLFKMRLNDVEVSNERISVLILDTKPYTPRYFVVTKLEWVKILQRYINLRRNIDLGSNRFSLHHRSGKLTRKLLGHNSVAKILLANRGGDVMQLKRLGGWKSSAVAEGYVENSLEGQLQLANLLTAPSNKPIQKREATSTVVYSKAFSDPDPSSHSMSSLAQPQCTTSTCPTAAVTNTNVYNFTREDVKQGLHLTINSHDQSKVYINFNHMVSNPQNHLEVATDFQESKPEEFIVYKERWLMLFLFVLCGASSTVQAPQYIIIADVAVKYYDVSYEMVNWSNLVYYLAYIVFAFPTVWIMDKWSLRTSILLGAFGTCAGAWIKVASVAPDRFWVVLFGQFISAASQVILFTFPAPLAATWFSSDQVSTACAIGVCGLQLGSGIGFLISPMIVNSQKTSDIEQELYFILIGTALVCSVTLLVIFVTFKNEPPTPPSQAKHRARDLKKVGTLLSFKVLMQDISFLFLALSYGINIAVYYAISALLNQIVLKYYPNAAKDAGIIGLLMVFSSISGSVVFGIILDKVHKFRETMLATYAMSFLTLVALTFLLSKGLYIVYIILVLLGFFMMGFTATGLEVAAELTYPIPEEMSSGVIITSCQILGIIFVYMYSYLFYTIGDFYANLLMSACILSSTVLVLGMRFNLRRQRIQCSME